MEILSARYVDIKNTFISVTYDNGTISTIGNGHPYFAIVEAWGAEKENEIEVYTPPLEIPEWIPTWTDIRATRNELLLASDWTALTDVALTAEEKSECQAYRNLLRNITANYDFPTDVIWPTPPICLQIERET